MQKKTGKLMKFLFMDGVKLMRKGLRELGVGFEKMEM
jgi:hypothetical protein